MADAVAVRPDTETESAPERRTSTESVVPAAVAVPAMPTRMAAARIARPATNAFTCVRGARGRGTRRTTISILPIEDGGRTPMPEPHLEDYRKTVFIGMNFANRTFVGDATPPALPGWNQ